MRRGAHRVQRLLVVHAERAEQADGTERLMRVAVGRADEREIRSPGCSNSSPTRANERRGSSRCASTSSSAARFSSASIRLR